METKGITTHLTLKRPYYDAIAKGTKKKEFRDGSNPYYDKKFAQKIDYIVFHCNSSVMKVEVTGIVKDKRQNMYVIGLGRIVSNSDEEPKEGKQ